MKPKGWISIVFSLLLVTLPSGGQPHSAIPADPVNPHASPEVRALVKYLSFISGHYTLSGQHNYTIRTTSIRASEWTLRWVSLGWGK